MTKSKRKKTQKTVTINSSDSKVDTGSSNENNAMVIEDNVKNNKSDEEQTNRKAIESLGTVTDAK
jgi:3,4-dihydroxy-2-butanone 4-phosphate synthase